MSNYTEESVLAKQLGLEHATMRKRRKRAQRTGKPLVPPYVEIARKFFYSNDGTAEWLKAIQQGPARLRK